MERQAAKCRICHAQYSPEKDREFLHTGYGDYCSSACLNVAMAEPEAERELEFEADTRHPHQARIEQAFAEGPPRVCRVCCDLETLHRDADAAQQVKPGGFYDVTRAAEARYPLLANFFGVMLCSLACARKVLAEVPRIDCKNYWERDGMRCTHCRSIFRPDEGDEGCIVVNSSTGGAWLDKQELEGHAADNMRFAFCSPQCVVDYFERHPEDTSLHWVPGPVRSNDGDVCCQCHKQKPQYVAVDAPFGSMWDSMNFPNYLCSVRCIVKAFRRDVKQCAKRGLGKWFKAEEEAA